MEKFVRNLVKCHFSYIVNKATLVIIAITLIISILSNLFSLYSLNPNLGIIENNQLYFLNSFLILKLVLIFLAIFLFSYSFYSKSDQYVMLIVTSNISRKKYFITKVIVLITFLSGYIYLEYFIFLLVGAIFYRSFYFNINHLIAYGNLLLSVIYFGLLGQTFILLLNNLYTMIIPFILMNIGSIINEENEKIMISIYNYLVPTLTENSDFYYGYLHLVGLLMIIFMMNLFIYERKDLS